MAESISFDRAAESYDATRAEPPAVAAAINEALLAGIRAAGGGPVLEVGIGTGRIGRPLAAQGVPMVGVDISPAMTRRLLAQADRLTHAPQVILGDAMALPFKDGTFRAALVVHVLHLVGSLGRSIAEIRRVLAPGGPLLHQVHSDSGAFAAVGDKFTELLRARGIERQRGPDYEDIAAALIGTGAERTTRNICQSLETRSSREMLEEVRNKVHSWTWRIPDDAFDDCLPEFESWFRDRYGDRDISETTSYALDTWSWPST
jgi:ubiquinone/menaquinone biosynthesis C-methylase UbiE